MSGDSGNVQLIVLFTWTGCGEEQIADFHNTFGTGSTHSEDRTGVALRLEIVSTRQNNGPGLANDRRSGGNGDSVRDMVYTSIEEEDLATIVLYDSRFERTILGFPNEINHTWSRMFWMAVVSSVLPSPFAP